ncbi:transporter [Brevundimonas sp.]|uniref:SphA family protein n=1 Tax=Brevundimonas sp. TaxID=1871086 RepID=UPI0028A1C178|nr:transporter [Brevundimonas sp.]
MARLKNKIMWRVLAVLGAGWLGLAGEVQASESGTSVYLLGSGGPGTAIMPPVRGVFFANSAYYYSGEAGAALQIPIGGSIVADLDATVVADFPAALWVPTTDFAGGTLALAMVVPLGRPDISVSAVISDPQGNPFSGSRQDDAFVVGDPVLNAMLGWTKGNYHWQVSTMVNVPIGDYRKDQLANLAFNRWAVDGSAALTWHDAESGWDISAKTGLTFNGENDHTAYETGTEWHTEVSVERIFSETFSAGVQVYRFQQISGDSGAGARLGEFKGEATGVGVTAA